MNMKLKYLAAACMGIFAPASFAATTLACDPSTAEKMVNTCAPEVKMFIAGSSALGGAISAVVQPDLFDTSTVPLIKVVDNGSANGNAAGGAKAVSAWYGMSKAALTGGTSKRLFVVYNNNNGSAAGVSQLLAKLGTVAEADVVTIGPVKNVAGTCAADAASTAAVPVIDCTTHGFTQADVAISDVAPAELYKLYASATGKLSSLASTVLAMQGFGVAVNANLYSALQTQNIADHRLPATCTPGDTTAACQPSIRRADYASLVSKQGTIKSAAALLGNPSDGTVLTLARRDDLSGTQASSNMFFADNACGNSMLKNKAIAGVLGGELDILSSIDVVPASLVVQANATTGAVKAALNAASGYAIGVLGLGTVPGGSDTWKYVKIDGVSPNFNADGSVDANQRNAFRNGDYQFAVASVAATLKKADPHSVVTQFPLVHAALITGLQDSTLHNLKGIGYLNGAADPSVLDGQYKQSAYHRNNGNNCSPLIK